MIKLICGAAAAVALIVAAFIAFTMEHHWKVTHTVRPAGASSARGVPAQLGGGVSAPAKFLSAPTNPTLGD